MHRIYFKQAMQMIRQNAFISLISIFGTSLAIMMVMTIVVTGQVKNINLSPEIHRDRTLYIGNEITRDTTAGKMSSSGTNLRYNTIREYFSDLETPEMVALATANTDWFEQIMNETMTDIHEVSLRRTDENFWKLFSFTFLKGEPFTYEEVDSQMDVAILTENTARKIFGDQDPMGRNILYDFKPYRVKGIVKDVSPVFDQAYGEVFLPLRKNGRLRMFILARLKDDFPAIKREIKERAGLFTLSHAPKFLELDGPVDHRVATADLTSYATGWNPTGEIRDRHYKTSVKRSRLILALLLLVPAVNLSGFSLSRIRKRMPEIGIRKAFGAKRSVILVQVLYENMITSLVGGFVGLILSFASIFRFREWLLGIPEESGIPFASLVSVPVFVAVFFACLVLNLLSAGIPAYRAARTNIIASLTHNESKK